MADAPTSYTTNYSFKKWNDTSHPGAIGWNANWDAIDQAIKNASLSGPASSYSFSAPLLNTDGTISLNISDNLKLTGSNLDTIQGIKTSNTVRFAKLGLGMDASVELDVAGSGHLTGDAVIDGNLTVNGDTVVLNAYELDVEDKNIVLGNVASPSNATAAGGGITLKGLTDKTLIWNNDGKGWTSSEDINIVSTKGYKIDGTYVLSNNTLGVNVVNSSLTKVGTLTTGTWNADAITVPYGGTGLTSFTLNKLYKGNNASALSESNITDSGSLITLGSDALITGNMTVDGSLTLFELILQRLSYRNGTEVIGDGAKIESVDDGIGRCYCVDFVPFAVNDIVKAQKFSGGTSGTVLYANVLKVLSVNTTYKWFNYEVISGTDPIEGQEYVRIGNYTNADRQGSIVLTASLDNAPYIDIKDGVNDPALFEPSGLASDTIKGRFGKLTGIQDADFANIGGADSDGYLPGYGVYLNGSAFIKGNIIADAGYIGGTSGWEITAGTITGGDTRLENSTDFKGLAVNNGTYDCMKIGDFTIDPFTDSPSNLTSSYVTNANFESGSFTGWTATGSGATRSVVAGGASSGSWSALVNCSNYTTLAFAYDIRQSFANPTSLQGRHIQIKPALKLGDWYDAGTGNHPSVIAPVTVTLTNQNGTFALKKFTPGSSWSDFLLEAVVPSDSTAVTLIMSGNFASAQNYYSTCIDNVRVLVYDKAYNYQNSLGISLYNSPWNYFRMQGGALSMGVSDLEVNGYKPILFDTTQPDKPIGPMLCKVGGAVMFFDGTGWTELALA